MAPELFCEVLALGFDEDMQVGVWELLEEVAIAFDIDAGAVAEDGEDVELSWDFGGGDALVLGGAEGDFGVGVAIEPVPEVPGELLELGIVGLEEDAEVILGVELFGELLVELGRVLQPLVKFLAEGSGGLLALGGELAR